MEFHILASLKEPERRGADYITLMDLPPTKMQFEMQLPVIALRCSSF